MNRKLKPVVLDRIPIKCSEGPFWGNGIIGTVLYIQENRIRLSMDHTAMWETRENLPDKPTAAFNEILLNKERFRKGERSMCAPTDIFDFAYGRTKLPGLRVSLVLPDSVSKFYCSTDIEKAKSHLSLTLKNGGKLEGEIYLHSTSNLLQINFTGNDAQSIEVLGEGWDLNLPALKALKFWEYPPCIQTRENGTDLIYQEYSENGCAVLAVEKTLSGNSINITAALDAGNLPASGINPGGSSFFDKTSREEMKTQVLSAINASKEPGFFDKHLDSWQTYWNTSDLVMPNRRLQAACDLERYKIFCNERSDSSPVTLQGVWNTDDRMPAWFGDLHNDLNVQSCYWAAFRTGNAQLAAPYIDFYSRAVPRFMERAEKLFGIKNAIHIPVMMAPSGYAAASEWCFWNVLLGPELFVATDFCWFYEYTQDLQVLREKIYPFLCGVVRLYMGIAIEKNDEFLHIPFSQSPEIDGDDGMMLHDDPGYALSVLHYVLGKLKIYGGLLTEDTSVWENFDKKLAPVPTDETGFQVFKGIGLEHSHRHFCHLYPIFPLEIQGHNEIANKSLDTAIDRGFMEFAAFSFPYLAIFASRCGRGNMARTMLEIYCMTFRSRNSFTVNGDPYQNGVIRTASTNAGESSDSFTLESGFFLPAVLSEMMLHRVNNEIWVFPAIPDDWKSCSFKDLAVQGNHRVSAEFDDYHFVSGSLMPGKTEEMVLCFPDSQGDVIFSGVNAEPCRLPHVTEKIRSYKVSLIKNERITFNIN